MSAHPMGFNHEHEPLLIVISGPSGVGKDTVLQRMKERNLPFHYVVTATTRPKRPNETDGVDYFFVSEEEFQRMIDEGELMEHALVYDEHKGIPKKQVREALDSGKDVVVRVDVQGAGTIRQLEPNAILVFLTTTDEDELINRLKSRRTESPEKLNLRIETARQEYKRIDEFDYKVANRDNELDETVDTILAIVSAERHRVAPRRLTF